MGWGWDWGWGRLDLRPAQLALFSLTLRNSRPVLAVVFRASHTTVTAGGALGSSLLCCPPVKLVLGYFCFRF